MANAGLRDEEQIRKGIERAKFVQKGEWPFFLLLMETQTDKVY